jgi:hypothetical protein
MFNLVTIDLGALLGATGSLASIVGGSYGLYKIFQKRRRLVLNKKDKFRIDLEKLWETESAYGLTIGNRELLLDDSILQQNKVYWPVVPARTPNLIHLSFVLYLDRLIEAGFKPIMVVLDAYYCRLGDDRVEEDVQLFIKGMKKIGLSNQATIEFESNLQQRDSKLLVSLLDYFGGLTKQQFDEFATNNSHVNSNAPFIRYIKPALNMLYLVTFGSEYGFTLSGADEQDIWDKYDNIIGIHKQKRYVNLYIPKMLSATAQETHVHDTRTNIAISDTPKDIKNKILESINMPPSPLARYIVDYLFPLAGCGTILNCQNSDFDSLIEFTNINGIQAEDIADAIATQLIEFVGVANGKA